MTKSDLRRKGSFHLTACTPSCRELKAGRNLKAEADSRDHGATLLTSLPSPPPPLLSQAAFSIQHRTACPEVARPHRAGPSHINQENPPRPILFSAEVPFSQMPAAKAFLHNKEHLADEAKDNNNKAIIKIQVKIDFY